MKRIFVAVDISEKARAIADAYISDLKCEFPDLRVGWEKPEKLHLTLKFLGDCDARQLEDLENAVRISAKKFGETLAGKITMKLSGTGVFPSKRNPRIMWLGIEDEEKFLTKLNEILEDECEKIGFEKERRAYKPHLTIGRVREPHKAAKLAESHLQKTHEPVEFCISEIVIYESKLLPTGSIYKKLKSFSFSK